MTKKKDLISIIWSDARLYHFKRKEKESLTKTKCIGELVEDNKEFIILKKCQQLVFNKDKNKYILKRKANFFFIPKGMIMNVN